MNEVGQEENLSGAKAALLPVILTLFIPLLIGFLAIAQDMHWVATFNACVKDIIFTVLLIQVVAHTSMGEGVKRFGWGIVLLGWGLAVFLEPWIADWMPDTWILSQRRVFSGWPVAEVLVLLLVSGSVLFGCKTQRMGKRDGFTYGLGMLLMLASARLWFAHLDYQAAHPESTWLPDQPYESVTLIEGKSFVGKNWLIEHADYTQTMTEVKAMLSEQLASTYWWGGLKASQEPHVFKATAVGASVVLSYQAKPLEWQGKTSWTWMGVGSFLLVFLEVFLLSRLMVVQGVGYLRSKTKDKSNCKKQL